MSVLVEDAVASMPPEDRTPQARQEWEIILYADDTLLISSSSKRLQRLLMAVAEAGADYGMELHWGKFQLLQIRGTYSIDTPDGSRIAPCDKMIYLGTTLASDGNITGELTRRLGAAWGDFTKPLRLWKHTSLTR